ncbi:Ics2 [Kluyveromyces lactis]|nr:Ics2 [Kluyveromyces lactis]
MTQEFGNPRTAELFLNNYEMNFDDEGDRSKFLTGNSVSPRSLSKAHFPRRHMIKGSPAQHTLLQSSSENVLRPAIKLGNNNTAAIRMRNFSFPNDLQSDNDTASEQELRRPSSLTNLSQGKPVSRSSQQSVYTSPTSYSTSAASSPRRSTKSGTNSSFSFPANYSSMFKGYNGLAPDAVDDHIQRENESENLFNQLRNYKISSENNSVSFDDDADSDRFKSVFLAHSRKSSIDSPTMQLRDFKKRRPSSLISGSSLTSNPVSVTQLSPRSTFHKRATAMTDSQEMVSVDDFTPKGRQSDMDIHDPDSGDYLDDKRPTQSLRTLSLDDGSSETISKHSLVPSPKLTIENTKEQIRRNSNGHFENFHQFAKLNGLDRYNSVFANLPETGDNVSDSVINLDFVNDFKLQKPPRTKKYRPHFQQRLSTAISEETSSAESSPSRDDEMMTLIDFLKAE